MDQLLKIRRHIAQAVTLVSFKRSEKFVVENLGNLLIIMLRQSV